MKNLIYLFIGSLLLSSCVSGNPDTVDSVPEKSNGFVMGTGQTIMLGGNESVEIVKKIDAAWLARDYDTMKSYIADDAKLYHDDGRVSTGPEEFVAAIEDDYNETIAEGNEWSWVMNFGFSVKVSESENEEQWNDDGEWVSARFTTAADEVYEEWYYIVDGKLSWYGSAKRGLYSE